MFDSDGCADIRGMGLAESEAYSFVSLLCAAFVAMANGDEVSVSLDGVVS